MLRTLLALAACLFSAATSAGSFNIAPIRIELPAARRAASLEVQNTGDAPAQLQVERFLWKRDNGGADELEPTEAFVVTPPIFTLQPGQRQIVRVLMLVPPDPLREGTYRLILQETPLGDPPPNTVATLLRISLPLFVTPPGAKADLSWRLVRDGAALQLEAGNRGTAHAFISQVQTVDGAPLRIDGYLLPGEQRRWPVDSAPQRLNVTLRDGTESVVEVRPAP
jgi:fimbrial chaperone protein